MKGCFGQVQVKYIINLTLQFVFTVFMVDDLLTIEPG